MPDSPAEITLAVIGMARDGRFEEVRDLFVEQLRPMVAAEALRAAWDAEVSRLGPICSVGAPVSEEGPQHMVVVRALVTGERGSMAVVASLTRLGQLTGIQLAPPSAAEPITPWEPPGYARPEQFEEAEVTVGLGPLAVPGTCTLPKTTRPCPGVVLLAGSGPNDRDGTIGRNKPLKDVAWGLASQGIAVLRFDKVTFAHPAEVKANLNFTVVDEYVDHATFALHLLSSSPAVEDGRVFLAGHSLGGSIAPRVAATEPSIAGIVLLAGGAQPLPWSAVRQVRYLASLDPAASGASRTIIDAMTEQAKRVDSPDLSPSTPPSDLPFGVPAAYWLDLRSYQPAEAAAQLDKPFLILQGGRDYQVTVDDDLAMWRRALDGRKDVSFRVYPADNHFFFSGSGPSAPAETEPAQHVDADVVFDIANWVNSGRLPPERRPHDLPPLK
jgi:uncharacterized protein